MNAEVPVRVRGDGALGVGFSSGTAEDQRADRGPGNGQPGLRVVQGAFHGQARMKAGHDEAVRLRGGYRERVIAASAAMAAVVQRIRLDRQLAGHRRVDRHLAAAVADRSHAQPVGILLSPGRREGVAVVERCHRQAGFAVHDTHRDRLARQVLQRPARRRAHPDRSGVLHQRARRARPETEGAAAGFDLSQVLHQAHAAIAGAGPGMCPNLIELAGKADGIARYGGIIVGPLPRICR